MKRAITLAALVAGLSACPTEVVDFGEALMVITTDVDVARFATRVRLDVYDEKLTWLASQDVGAPSALSWPVSFSVVHPSEVSERLVWVRIRSYPDGAVRDYRGRTPLPAEWAPPTVAEGLPALCGAAPELPLGGELTLRRGSGVIAKLPPFTDGAGETHCSVANASGSVAARVTITKTGNYTFGVIRSLPDARIDATGSATLSLRLSCADETSQLACADPKPLPTITATLNPGTYFLVTGGSSNATADLVLRADEAERFSALPPRPEEPAARRLVVDGVDVTPATEPEPRTSIDRLIGVRLRPGLRGNVSVHLAGECLGTEADLDGKRSCIDREATLSAVSPIEPAGVVERVAPTPSPWPAMKDVPCAGALRRDASTGVDEVCVHGGAFLLGDRLALGESTLVASNPMRPRVIPPFFFDRAEVTVGRYRLALKHGFVPTGTSPTRNDLPLAPDAQCTWNEGATPTEPASSIARESLPLNCVDWATARAFCRFFGSDLPTEEQWEYAASAAGKALETQYPWGDAAPDCNRTAFGRFIGMEASCPAEFGPVSVDATPFLTQDVTPAGVIGLAGNVAEWTLDGPQRFDHARWDAARLRQSPAFDETAPMRVVRGTSWDGVLLWATSTVRRARSPLSIAPGIGFRCARKGDAP